MKLGDIINLRTGLVLNRKVVSKGDKFIKYNQLTLKSIIENGIINKNALDIFYSKERLKLEYFTQKNDVIVRLSYPYTAILIDDGNKNLLVPSHFVIIKCNENILNPGYLQWVLNSERVKNKISKLTSTSFLGTISTKFFINYDIDIPPLSKQEMIYNINKLAQKENLLLNKLREEKNLYYKLLTNKIQKEMEKENDNKK